MFGDHQPMYRQEDIHSRLGMTIRRSTLCGWQVALAALAAALVMRMKHLLLQSLVVYTDDTSIKMLNPGAGTTTTAKFWPHLGGTAATSISTTMESTMGQVSSGASPDTSFVSR